MAGIGRYEIVEQIGEGGMGTVYKAEQPTLKKTVALKVLSDFCARDEELLARFKREARIMAALPDYSHVVQVYDLDEAEGKWFYTMEYIPFSLAEHIGEGDAATDRTRVRRSTPRALPVEETQSIIEQILKGLTVIHEAGVVHRDICPRNVLLAKDGVALTVKVTDFGIAGRHGSHLTRTGMSGMGKEIFAAPEQEESLSHADGRSDLYSVGVLAYRLVTGRLPKGRFKDPMAISPNVTDGLNGWILQLLEQEPEDRFESARAALDALRSSRKTNPSANPVFKDALHPPKPHSRSTSKAVSQTVTDQRLNDAVTPVGTVTAVPAKEDVAGAASDAVSPTAASPTPVKKKMSKSLVFLWIFIILGGAGYGTYYFLGKSGVGIPFVSGYLRSSPKTVSDSHFRSEFGLDVANKPKQYIQNDYVDNGDGTITDRATGLMWQQSGSDKYMNYDDAKTYIDDLNRSRLAGHSDWRLPTIPELMSLLEPTKKNGDLYIDPVFDNKQSWCWSADSRDSGSAWLVLFYGGEVHWSLHASYVFVRAVRCGQ